MKKNLFYAVGLLGTLLVTGCNTQANVAQTQAKEIALRKILPIIKNDNTYKQINVNPINRNTKDI